VLEVPPSVGVALGSEGRGREGREGEREG
jgi:hypothetical protein